MATLLLTNGFSMSSRRCRCCQRFRSSAFGTLADTSRGKGVKRCRKIVRTSRRTSRIAAFRWGYGVQYSNELRNGSTLCVAGDAARCGVLCYGLLCTHGDPRFGADKGHSCSGRYDGGKVACVARIQPCNTSFTVETSLVSSIYITGSKI